MKVHVLVFGRCRWCRRWVRTIRGTGWVTRHGPRDSKGRRCPGFMAAPTALKDIIVPAGWKGTFAPRGAYR